MESKERRQTLVLYPDSNCSQVNNLLESINQYVLKVHEHSLGSNVFTRVPARKGEDSVSTKDSDVINPEGCRLCSVAIDGVPLRAKRSRTYGVEVAEEAYEYHQSDDTRSEKEVCTCSHPCSKTTKNIFVKINNNDKEIIEWFRKVQTQHTPRRNKKKTTAVKVPFTALVTNSSTSTAHADNVKIDISLQRTPDPGTRKSKASHRRVSFEDQTLKYKLAKAGNKPVFREFTNILKRIANMFRCGQSCQCSPERDGQSLGGDEGVKPTDSHGSMTNLVMSVNSKSGEEKFVGLTSWDTNRDAPVYLMVSRSGDLQEDDQTDIVEILRNRSILSPSTTTCDIFSRDQGPSKRNDS